MTLRTRFALWVATLLLVALAAFGTVVFLTVSGWLSAGVDDALRLSATQLVATSDVDRGRIDVPEQSLVLDPALSEELRSQGFTVQVFAASGRLVTSFGLFADLPLDPGDLQAARDGRTNLTTRPVPSGPGSVRVLTQGVPGAGTVVAVVQVSQSLAASEALRGTLLSALLLGAPILVVVAALGGYLLAGRALAPIDEITSAARRISAENLSGRLALPSSKDEVGRLAATFDEMLARLDDAFSRERRFTHDAAHELRTPLAAMQSILSVIAERRRTPDDYEAALSDLSQETARLAALTEDLLSLARAEAATEASEHVDVSALLVDVAETMRPAADAKGLGLTYAVEPGLAVVGDTDALVRLLLNLVENAVKFTSGGGVRVTGSAREGLVVVSVSDTGDGIGEQHVPHVFERFYRAEEARSTPGTGLGLAIALDIARAHRGDIAVRSVEGEGSTFTVTLPRATSAPSAGPTQDRRGS